MVFSGLVIAWRLAICPTSRSPESVNATIEGVVRLPSLLGMTTGSPLSMTATQEFVVPRSIPMTLLMFPPPPFLGGAFFRFGLAFLRRALCRRVPVLTLRLLHRRRAHHHH